MADLSNRYEAVMMTVALAGAAARATILARHFRSHCAMLAFERIPWEIIGLRWFFEKEFSKAMSFGGRLAEERKRLGLKQAEFAAMVGTDVPKQSLYENDRRELRADYLARLADANIDVVYVLTGQRSEGGWLSQSASELLSAYLCLPPDLQQALLAFTASLGDRFQSGSRMVHSRQSDYRPEDPDSD